MKIAILGSGAYGLGLGLTFYHQLHQVSMWTKIKEEQEMLTKSHHNQRALPNIVIPTEISFTTEMRDCVKDSNLIIIAVPIQYIEETIEELVMIWNNQPICIVSKGIEQQNHLLATDLLAKKIKTSKVGILSGPTFAIDLLGETPMALTLATYDRDTKQKVNEAFGTTPIYIEDTNDIIGVQICGAIKNCFAIACGILDGLDATASTKATFLATALQETKTIVKKLGGDDITILTYSGIGDILLTCQSIKSRNFTYGRYMITKNESEIEEYRNSHTIEGLNTIESLQQLLIQKKINSPLITLLHDIIIKNNKPSRILNFLQTKKIVS